MSGIIKADKRPICMFCRDAMEPGHSPLACQRELAAAIND